MKQDSENPQTNNLGAGLDEKEILEAIDRAGYPLQIVISDKLKKYVRVQQEWNFTDEDSGKQRAIDIFGNKELYEMKDANKYKIRPALNLIIECKKSITPYVFFLSGDRPWKDFPMITGIPNESIDISSDDTKDTYVANIIDAISLDEESFVNNPPASSNSFTKCVRGSSKLECSGEEPYNSLILPILKSMNYFKKNNESVKSNYYNANLILGIGVVDGPMIGVKISEDKISPILLPWVRIIKHQSIESKHWWERDVKYAVDIIHKDYFDTYIMNHVLPFAKKFGERMQKHHKIIVNGKAFAKGLNKDSKTNLTNRIKEKK